MVEETTYGPEPIGGGESDGVPTPAGGGRAHPPCLHLLPCVAVAGASLPKGDFPLEERGIYCRRPSALQEYTYIYIHASIGWHCNACMEQISPSPKEVPGNI